MSVLSLLAHSLSRATGTFVSAIVALALLGAAAPMVLAQPGYTLYDNSASITLNTGPNLAAIDDWYVGGIDHLFEFSNWYRVGSSGPERSCNNLTYISSSSFNTNADPRDDLMSVLYRHPQFDIAFDYRVFGDPLNPGRSIMGETVYITNTSASPLPFHFFEYWDLDLTDTALDDTVVQTSPSTSLQTDGITNFSAGITNCDRYELNTAPLIRNRLDPTFDLLPTNLIPNGFGVPFGPGDVSLAFQFDFVGFAPPRPMIPVGATVIIQKDCLLETQVPEPASAAMLMMFGAMAVARRRR